jgi:hypothetical protein
VALSPQGFGANLALGDAAAVAGDPAAAQTAYQVALGRTREMEPSARKRWAAKLETKLAAVAAKAQGD